MDYFPTITPDLNHLNFTNFILSVMIYPYINFLLQTPQTFLLKCFCHLPPNLLNPPRSPILMKRKRKTAHIEERCWQRFLSMGHSHSLYIKPTPFFGAIEPLLSLVSESAEFTLRTRCQFKELVFTCSQAAHICHFTKTFYQFHWLVLWLLCTHFISLCFVDLCKLTKPKNNTFDSRMDIGYC